MTTTEDLRTLPQRTTPPRTIRGRSPLERLRGVSATTAKYLSLIVAAVVTLLPLSVLLFASLKTAPEYAQTGPFDPPENWLNFDNFVTAFTSGEMLEGFINTTIVLVVSLAGTVFIGTMAAYALDRFAFRGKKLVFGLFLVATLIPGAVSYTHLTLPTILLV